MRPGTQAIITPPPPSKKLSQPCKTVQPKFFTYNLQLTTYNLQLTTSSCGNKACHGKRHAQKQHQYTGC